MANFTCVQFATIVEDKIYFEVENPDYEADSYKKGSSFTKMIQNGHSQFLVLDKAYNQIQLSFQELTLEQSKDSNCKFKIQSLLSDETDSILGFPVALQVEFEDKTWTLCCSDDGGVKAVNAKPEDLPNPILSNKHKAVFFLRQIEGQAFKYRVESSLWENMFLSFEHDPTSLARLVLKAKSNEDETQNLQIQNSCDT
ncbi:hypothetical protein GN956_G8015 [Arapaima gigas]